MNLSAPIPRLARPGSEPEVAPAGRTMINRTPVKSRAGAVRRERHQADYVISFGGDGTLIRAAHLCSEAGTPILGVYFGRFGFVTQFNGAEFGAILSELLDKRPRLEEAEFSKEHIYLLDRDGFSFEAKCHGGDLDITIVTGVGPNSAPYLRERHDHPTEMVYSKVLRASELYPRMYAHFAARGNPVKRLDGLWAWDNYDDCLPKFEELTKVKKMKAEEAAKIAVLEARTWKKYHQPQGFTEVVRARHISYQRVFSFLIVKPGSR